MKNSDSNYLTIAMSLIAISMSLLTFNIDRIFIGMCYGAALVFVIIFIKLKINRCSRQEDRC